jgi:hypothetical protein
LEAGARPHAEKNADFSSELKRFRRAIRAHNRWAGVDRRGTNIGTSGPGILARTITGDKINHHVDAYGITCALPDADA